MLNTNEYRGNVIAVSIWRWLGVEEKVDLAPQVCTPGSDVYDEVKTAEHRGRKKCLADLRALIESASEEMKGAVDATP